MSAFFKSQNHQMLKTEQRIRVLDIQYTVDDDLHSTRRQIKQKYPPLTPFARGVEVLRLISQSGVKLEYSVVRFMDPSGVLKEITEHTHVQLEEGTRELRLRISKRKPQISPQIVLIVAPPSGCTGKQVRDLLSWMSDDGMITMGNSDDVLVTELVPRGVQHQEALQPCTKLLATEGSGLMSYALSILPKATAEDTQCANKETVAEDQHNDNYKPESGTRDGNKEKDGVDDDHEDDDEFMLVNAVDESDLVDCLNSSAVVATTAWEQNCQFGDIPRYIAHKTERDKTLERELCARWSSQHAQMSSTSSGVLLREMIRSGLPDSFRELVWCLLRSINSNIATDYESKLKQALGPNGCTRVVRKPPLFGGEIIHKDHFLNDQGWQALHRVLSLIAISYPNITYCPQLPDILGMMLMFTTEGECFAIINSMLTENQMVASAALTSTFIGLIASTTDEAKIIDSTVARIKQSIPKIHSHFKKHRLNMTVMIREWFKRMFLCVLPYHIALCCVDVLLSEGTAALEKILVAIWSLTKQHILSTTTQEQLMEAICAGVAIHIKDCRDLLQAAFGSSESSDEKLRIERIASIHGPVQTQDIFYLPQVNPPSSILSDVQIETVWGWVPHRHRCRDLRRLFSTKHDGFNLSILFSNSMGSGPNLLFIQTLNGSIFGGFCSHEWRNNGKTWYGDGTCFIFTLHPTEQVYVWQEGGSFMCSNVDGIAMGCGHESFAFSLSSSLQQGTTGESITFKNKPLIEVDPSENHHRRIAFDVAILEVYAVV